MEPRAEDQPSTRPEVPAPTRHAGWAALVGVLGVAFVMIGAVLLGMIEAPAVRPKVIVTAVVLLAGGLVLLPVAWLGRRPSKH